MKATIKGINQRTGMVAALTEHGEYSVFELLGGGDVEVGEVVGWKSDTALGNEMLTNHTDGRQLNVFFQDHHCDLARVRELLG